MEVAQAVAAPYAGRGVALDDLRQVAYAALVRAARDFRPDKAENFLSYAVPTMRGEIRKYFRDFGWMVRPPRRLQEIQARVFDVRERLARAGAEPSTAQVAEELDLDPQDVEEALAAQGCFTPTPLDRPCRHDSATTVGDLIASDDDGFAQAEATAVVRPALERLSDRDRTIVQLRYYEGKTQQEIGEEIGVTQMQVSRLLNRIVADMREQVLGSRDAEAHPGMPA